MSYQTGNALDVNDLLDRFRLFLLANGWAVNFWGDRAGGQGKALQVNKGGNFYSIFSNTFLDSANSNQPGPYMEVMLHSSYLTPGSATQPDGTRLLRSTRYTSPMQAYHFFAGDGPNGSYAYMVVETDPGTYRHLGIGVLHKIGAYAGGAFCYALSWYQATGTVNSPDASQHGVPFDDNGIPTTSINYPIGGTVIRADYGGISPRYHYLDTGTTANPRGRGGWRNTNAERGTIALPVSAGASILTGRAPLIPLWCAVERGSLLWSDIGYPPGMRFVRMDNMEPGQEYPLGTDTWVVFPVTRKNGSAGMPSSGVYGYAFRKEL